jgi:hypothetical protein
LINEQNLSASVGDITLEGQSDQEGDRQWPSKKKAEQYENKNQQGMATSNDIRQTKQNGGTKHKAGKGTWVKHGPYLFIWWSIYWHQRVQ